MHTAAQAGAHAAHSLSCLGCARPATAGRDDDVATPIVEEGECEIDFKAGTRKLRDGTRESTWSIGFGCPQHRRRELRVARGSQAKKRARRSSEPL
jgi:hypothetical protein